MHDDLIAALERAEQLLHAEADSWGNAAGAPERAQAALIRDHIATLRAGGERAKVVALIETYRDAADKHLTDTGHGYCCLKTAANILGAVRREIE